jgi:hypothetical protein
MKTRTNTVNRLTDLMYILAQESGSPITRASLRTRLTNYVKGLGVEGVSEFIHNVIKPPVKKARAKAASAPAARQEETITLNGATYRKV